jgi:D-alanine-D-alanine ligase
MKITVIYNQGSLFEVSPEQETADQDTFVSAQQITKVLERSGYETEMLEIRPDTIEKITTIKSRAIFNLCEWSGKDFFLSVKVTQILAKMRVPYTGGDSRSMKWSADKVLMKEKFKKYGIRTPDWLVINKKVTKAQIKKLNGFKFPILLKPALEHCSIGVHQDSVIDDFVNCEEKINNYCRQFEQPVLVEEYIDGREIHVTVIKNGSLHILPPAEIIFLNKPGTKKLFTFESKWEITGSPRSVFSKTIIAGPDKIIDRQIKEITEKVFSNLKCKGYARLDFRIRNKKVYLLEVNVNPSIIQDPEYTVTISAQALGWDFDRLVMEIFKAGETVSLQKTV